MKSLLQDVVNGNILGIIFNNLSSFALMDERVSENPE